MLVGGFFLWFFLGGCWSLLFVLLLRFWLLRVLLFFGGWDGFGVILSFLLFSGWLDLGLLGCCGGGLSFLDCLSGFWFFFLNLLRLFYLRVGLLSLLFGSLGCLFSFGLGFKILGCTFSASNDSGFSVFFLSIRLLLIRVISSLGFCLLLINRSSSLRLDLNWGFEELVEDLVDLAVEDLT